MLEGNKIPETWRKSDLIPIFKGKGDVRSCGKYISITLLEHGMTVIERIFERRLRKVVKLDKMQMGFMPGRGRASERNFSREYEDRCRAPKIK